MTEEIILTRSVLFEKYNPIQGAFDLAMPKLITSCNNEECNYINTSSQNIHSIKYYINLNNNYKTALTLNIHNKICYVNLFLVLTYTQNLFLEFNKNKNIIGDVIAVFNSYEIKKYIRKSLILCDLPVDITQYYISQL